MSHQVQADIEQLRATIAAMREFSDALNNHHRGLMEKAQAFLTDDTFNGNLQVLFKDEISTLNSGVQDIDGTAGDLSKRLDAFAQRLEEADNRFQSPNSWMDEILGPKEARVIVDPNIALRKLYDKEISGLESTIPSRQQELRDNNVPVNEEHDTSLYSRKETIGTVLLNPKNLQTIEDIAKRYNIPPDLLMGIVASEMDFDHDNDDKQNDGLGRKGISLSDDQGRGIGNVHDETLIKFKNYLVDNKLDGYESAQQHSMSIKNLSSFDGSVESAAIVTKALIHHKGGVQTAEDKAVIWGAYRTGVKNFSPERDEYGYNSQADFQQNKANGLPKDIPEHLKIGRNAYQSQPYFELFQKAFELKHEAEQRNKEIQEYPFVSENRA